MYSRTRVRLPPPPDFARPTRLRASSWQALYQPKSVTPKQRSCEGGGGPPARFLDLTPTSPRRIKHSHAAAISAGSRTGRNPRRHRIANFQSFAKIYESAVRSVRTREIGGDHASVIQQRISRRSWRITRRWWPSTFMFYNFGRVHQTLRVTPAMETGIADHVWSIEEIVGLLG
jgi:hypothetical protein